MKKMCARKLVGGISASTKMWTWKGVIQQRVTRGHSWPVWQSRFPRLLFPKARILRSCSLLKASVPVFKQKHSVLTLLISSYCRLSVAEVCFQCFVFSFISKSKAKNKKAKCLIMECSLIKPSRYPKIIEVMQANQKQYWYSSRWT